MRHFGTDGSVCFMLLLQVLHRQLGDANQKLELAAAALQVPPPYVISGTDRAIPGMRGTLVSYVSRTRNGTCGTGGEYQESNAWY